jgi:ubiquinone/menaquinone biosynthesis C-methylase UbiE
MNDELLIEEGFAGRLSAGSAEFERFVDVTARRPSGESVAGYYREAEQHAESFELALDALELAADDRFLELCFGGGQVLERALQTVESAAGIDHSTDMHALARERNSEALAAGRLELIEGDIHKLPWPDGTFTRAACLNAFFFIEEPEQFLREVHRVLVAGSRLVIVTSPHDTAPSGPWAPALRTYPPTVLRKMLLAGGFADAAVDESSGHQLAVATSR